MKLHLMIIFFFLSNCIYARHTYEPNESNIWHLNRICLNFSRIELEVKILKEEGKFRYFDSIDINSSKSMLNEILNNNILNKPNYKLSINYYENAEIRYNVLNILGIVTTGIFPVISNRVSKIDVVIIDEKNKIIFSKSEIFKWNAYFALWGVIIYPISNVQKIHNEILENAVSNSISEFCI
ncbi:hypothetical protein [Leptospira noguchii]|uniref:Uncharacterized protein n=1 Tax=Leptospira noguchii TaxID=28182 RepID=M6VD18_9LEPT|nr:hypothetical protein [Leptospira noguchii]EMO54775.1 hypothetical protein LEP1GSC172_4329 [Leptospira noguchii]